MTMKHALPRSVIRLDNYLRETTYPLTWALLRPVELFLRAGIHFSMVPVLFIN